ncbi:MAG: Lrp/AsnC family transcriptional regulator [Desulfurococcales archaeon]|nr:Lrp/AsnC family transcriptional regulator [Desulfurococcales archaeon]
MPKVSMEELEKTALEMIRNSGSTGILQSDLWRRLGLDSREGSRLVLRLAKKGLIRREQVVVNGRRTYRLRYTRPPSLELKLKVDIEDVLDIPCFTCPFLGQCGPGNFNDPRTCPILQAWLERKARELLGDDGKA